VSQPKQGVNPNKVSQIKQGVIIQKGVTIQTSCHNPNKVSQPKQGVTTQTRCHNPKRCHNPNKVS